MQIVYSAFDNAPAGNNTILKSGYNAEELLLRLNAHNRVCEKYSAEIKRIQQYLPHWKPAFKIANGPANL